MSVSIRVLCVKNETFFFLLLESTDCILSLKSRKKTSSISISAKFKSAPSIFQSFRLNTLHQVKLACGKTESTDLNFSESKSNYNCKSYALKPCNRLIVSDPQVRLKSNFLSDPQVRFCLRKVVKN